MMFNWLNDSTASIEENRVENNKEDWKTREIVFYAFSRIIVEKLKNVGNNSIACLTRNNNGKSAVTFKLDPFIRISYTIRKEQWKRNLTNRAESLFRSEQPIRRLRGYKRRSVSSDGWSRFLHSLSLFSNTVRSTAKAAQVIDSPISVLSLPLELSALFFLSSPRALTHSSII